MNATFAYKLDETVEQATELVGREEQTAAGMDVDDTADTLFEKVEDDPKEDDAKSDATDPNMHDMVNDSE